MTAPELYPRCTWCGRLAVSRVIRTNDGKQVPACARCQRDALVTGPFRASCQKAEERR